MIEAFSFIFYKKYEETEQDFSFKSICRNRSYSEKSEKSKKITQKIKYGKIGI